MPKLKTKKAAAKRFSFTATGKVKFKRAGLRHMLSHRKTGEKVPLRKAGYMADGDRKLTEPTLPYGR